MRGPLMILILVSAMSLSAAVSVAQGTASGDPLKVTEAAILAAWDRVESLSCSATIRMRLTYGGMNLSASGAGPMVYKKAEAHDVMRLKLKGTLAVPAGDITSDMPLGFEVALDGKRVYTITSALWNKNAVIGDAPTTKGLPVPVGPLLFDSLRDSCSLRVGNSKSVNGVDSHVINAALKDPPSKDDPLGANAFRLYFAKDTGALVRVEAFNPAREPVGALDFTSIKLNPDIGPEQFVISIPQDAQVYDLRGGKPAKAEYFLPSIPGM